MRKNKRGRVRGRTEKRNQETNELWRKLHANNDVKLKSFDVKNINLCWLKNFPALSSLSIYAITYPFLIVHNILCILSSIISNTLDIAATFWFCTVCCCFCSYCSSYYIGLSIYFIPFFFLMLVFTNRNRITLAFLLFWSHISFTFFKMNLKEKKKWLAASELAQYWTLNNQTCII